MYFQLAYCHKHTHYIYIYLQDLYLYFVSSSAYCIVLNSWLIIIIDRGRAGVSVKGYLPTCPPLLPFLCTQQLFLAVLPAAEHAGPACRTPWCWGLSQWQLRVGPASSSLRWDDSGVCSALSPRSLLQTEPIRGNLLMNIPWIRFHRSPGSLSHSKSFFGITSKTNYLKWNPHLRLCFSEDITQDHLVAFQSF